MFLLMQALLIAIPSLTDNKWRVKADGNGDRYALELGALTNP